MSGKNSGGKPPGQRKGRSLSLGKPSRAGGLVRQAGGSSPFPPWGAGLPGHLRIRAGRQGRPENGEMNTGQAEHRGKLRNSWKMSNPSWGELLPGQGLPISKGVGEPAEQAETEAGASSSLGEPRPGGRSMDHFHLWGVGKSIADKTGMLPIIL